MLRSKIFISTAILILAFVLYIVAAEYLVAHDDGSHEVLYYYVKDGFDSLFLTLILLSYYIRVRKDKGFLRGTVFLVLLFMVFSTASAFLKYNFMNTGWGRTASYMISIIGTITIMKIKNSRNKKND